MSARELPSLDQFRALLEQAGFDEKKIVVEATGTIFAPIDDVHDPALDELRSFVTPIGGAAPELRLRASIGRGGMGQIRLADQIALGREVAVKVAVPGARDRHAAAASLVREARVTGALEHPNIVPVHALGKNEDGGVLMVMKRIEGTSWAELIAQRADTDDELKRHLEILMDVCRAVHFAHTRGVIHRDLKPQNVMVGPFGEVYALDWGLAVAIGDESVLGAPTAKSLTGVVGTPSYMAPEMTVPGSVLDERTDTYLLGGILHTLITGWPPHTASTISQRLHQAFLSEAKSFADDVPSELAAICSRSLSHDPGDRFASAEEMRVALDAFLDHASARALCKEAQARLLELEQLAGAGNPVTGPVGAAEEMVLRSRDRDAARAFSAATFGFENALRTWSASSEARDGVRAAHVAMARYEVARGHADAAAVHLAALRDENANAPADLVDAHDDLRARLKREADEKVRLEDVVRDLNPLLGQRRRGALLLGLALLWTVNIIVLGALQRAGTIRIDYVHVVGAHIAMLSAFALAYVVARGRIVLTRVGRSLVITGVTIPTVNACMWIGLWFTQSSLVLGLALSQLIMGFAILLGAFFVDTRLVPTALVGFSGFPLVLAFSEYAFEANGINTALTGVALAITWRADLKAGAGTRSS